MADIVLDEMLWPEGHPYHWPTIGYMEDLTAASHDDVVQFFKTYYAPNNASLVIAGDIDLDAAQRLVEKWFGEIPRGPEVLPIAPPAARLTGVQKRTLLDRVRLPQLQLAWLTPRRFAPGDAALDVLASVLADGKNSRLYKRLVYDTQIAQDVIAFQGSATLGSAFRIVATARPGHTAAELKAAIDEEIARLQREPPTAREVERARNQIEASFYRRMERVGGFGGKADQLNDYHASGGGPDYFAEDLARYLVLTPADVQSAARQWLPAERRVELVVEPEEGR
jgi:zinc protease